MAVTSNMIDGRSKWRQYCKALVGIERMNYKRNNKEVSAVDMANVIAGKTGLSPEFSETIIEEFLDAMTFALLGHKIVKLGSFGTFRVEISSSNDLNSNVSAGGSIVCQPRSVIKFESTNELDGILNW